jgi:ribonuclease T2
MRWERRMAAAGALAAVAVPGVATAQALQCTAPARLPRPHPDLPSADQPRRLMQIGGYTLALTWNPGFCQTRGADPEARFQCGGTARFGFTLHGLWPDGTGRSWPQYCTPTALVPDRVVRGALCATPSVQLIQHEWAKHGTCMRTSPARYFARSVALYRALRFPDMGTPRTERLTVGEFKRRFAQRNLQLPIDAIRVTLSNGWLDELWLCLDTRFRYERCRAGTGGAADGATMRIAG